MGRIYLYFFILGYGCRESWEYNIHDDTYNIGYEDIVPELLDKEVEAQLLSISIGKFKDKDQYLIYYREIDVANQKGNTNYDLYFIK